MPSHTKFGDTPPRDSIQHPVIGQVWPVDGGDTYDLYCGPVEGWVQIEREKMRYKKTELYAVKFIPYGYFAGYNPDWTWKYTDDMVLAEKFKTREAAVERGMMGKYAGVGNPAATAFILENITETVSYTITSSSIPPDSWNGDWMHTAEAKEIIGTLLRGNVYVTGR
jgi:hypothetical protein